MSLALSFIALIQLFTGKSVSAAGNTCTWTGEGIDNNFSTAANWSGCNDGVPGNGDNLAFDEKSTRDNFSYQVNNDISGLSVQNISVSGLISNMGGTQIGGDEITVTSGIEVSQHRDADPNLNINFYAPLKLGGDITITGANQHITAIRNRLDLNGHTLTHNDAGARSLVLTGSISGNGNIIANHNVLFTESPANCYRNDDPCDASASTWTGNLSVEAGGSAEIYPGSLGDNDINVIVADGGFLHLVNFNGGSFPQKITLGGNGKSIEGADGTDVPSGAILAEGRYTTSGNVTLSGSMTLTSNTGIRSRTATRITGPISGNFTLSFLPSSPGPGPVYPYCSEYNEPCSLLLCSSDNQSLTPNSSNCSDPVNTPTPTPTNTPAKTPTPTRTPTPSTPVPTRPDSPTPTKTVPAPPPKPIVLVLSGKITDSGSNILKNTNITLACNSVTRTASTNAAGSFAKLFLATTPCRVGNTVTITASRNGVQGTGTATVQSGGKLGTVKLAFADDVSEKVKKVIDWANGFLDKEAYYLECLKFVHDAWNAVQVDIGRGGNPIGYWNSNPKGYAKHTDANPPAGALVFWGASRTNSEGHVALSLGSSRVISTYAFPNPRTDHRVFTFAISARDPKTYSYLGWMLPQ